MQNKTGKKKILVGCEPTGYYWLTFQKFLQEHGVQLVTVNPYSVKKCKELNDNSPEKSDLKDPKTIAGLVKDGDFRHPICRQEFMLKSVRLSCAGSRS